SIRRQLTMPGLSNCSWQATNNWLPPNLFYQYSSHLSGSCSVCCTQAVRPATTPDFSDISRTTSARSRELCAFWRFHVTRSNFPSPDSSFHHRFRFFPLSPVTRPNPGVLHFHLFQSAPSRCRLRLQSQQH